MKKLLTVVLTFAFMASSANQLHAQAPQRCVLTEANAPAVRGIRLGMTTQQLAELFAPGLRRKELRDALERGRTASGNEAVYVAFDPATDASGDQFAGVASVLTGVYKNKVVDFSIVYVGPTWGNIDEWVAKLSDTFKLPGARDWVQGPSENPNKVLRCSGIEIEAAIQGGGCSVRVRTTESHSDQTSSGDNNKRFKP